MNKLQDKQLQEVERRYTVSRRVSTYVGVVCVCACLSEYVIVTEMDK